MKQIMFALIVTLSIAAFASEPLVIDKLIYKPSDLSASSNLVNDINGNPCGLVKVISNDKSLSFEGSVIGTPEYKNGEYWVYMPKGTYQLKVKSDKYEPAMLNFKDYNLTGVDSKATYELTFNIHEYKPLFAGTYKVIEGTPLKKYISNVLTVPEKSYAQNIISQIKADTELADLCTISLIGNISDGEIVSYSIIATSSEDEVEVIFINSLFKGPLNPEIMILTQL